MAESELLAHLSAAPPLRTPGTAVYLSRDQGVPRTLLHTLALYRALHRLVIVLTVRVEPLPRVARRPRHHRALRARPDRRRGPLRLHASAPTSRA